MLVQLFDFTRQDMLLCGSFECINTNGNYQVMWADSYQPNPGDNCAIPLYDYFSNNNVDNWATTQSSTPSGYVPATFANGNVLNCNGPNRRCVDVYWNSQTTDHLTTANPQGAEWAVNHGYTKVNSCIGYAYVTDEATPQMSHDELVQYVAKIRSIASNATNPEGESQPTIQSPNGGMATQIALSLLQSMGAY